MDQTGVICERCGEATFLGGNAKAITAGTAGLAFLGSSQENNL